MTTAWTTDVATLDAARAVRLTLLWGLDGVALRLVGGERVPTINEAPLRARLQDAELPVVAVDPGLFEGDAARRALWLNDLDALDEVAAFCDRVGCRLVRVGALGGTSADAGDPDAGGLAADALRQAGERAARHGLRLAVRNQAGTGVATGAALAQRLSAAGHPALAADWRPADALGAGEAPADGLAALVEAGHAPACVGVRDAAGGQTVEVGAGAVGWAEHFAALARAGADGPLVIDGLPEPARRTGLASATALIRMARRAPR